MRMPYLRFDNKNKKGKRKMSTYMPNPQTVERKWYILDAAGKPLGRVAAKAAHILRGKQAHICSAL